MLDFVDLLPLLLILLFLSGIKVIHRNSAINENYLSISTGNILRGLFAIVVVFHHLSQRMESGYIFQWFRNVGHLAVAVFFFLSGYGLQKSHIKSEKYKNHFFQKRMQKILVPYVSVGIIYWIFYALTGNLYSLKDIFVAIFTGKPIMHLSWYLICLCYFYVAFWCMMHICNKKHNFMILCACIWLVLYIFICRKLEYGNWWYITAHLLVVGMVWATHEQKIISSVKKSYPIILLLTILGFFVTFRVIDVWNGELLFLGTNMISSVLFVLSVILLSLKADLKNYIFCFLGNISLELYLVHGLVLGTLRSEIVYIKNDFLWSLAAIGGSIFWGWILHRLFSKMQKYR